MKPQNENYTGRTNLGFWRGAVQSTKYSYIQTEAKEVENLGAPADFVRIGQTQVLITVQRIM